MSTDFHGVCIADWLSRNGLVVTDTPRVELRCASKGCGLLLGTIYLPKVTEGVTAIGKTTDHYWSKMIGRPREDEFYILRGYPGAIKVYACPRHTLVKSDMGTVTTADQQFHKRLNHDLTLWHEGPPPTGRGFPAVAGAAQRWASPLRAPRAWPIRCSDLRASIERARVGSRVVVEPLRFTEFHEVCEYCLKLPFPGCDTEHSVYEHRPDDPAADPTTGFVRRAVTLAPAQPCYCKHTDS